MGTLVRSEFEGELKANLGNRSDVDPRLTRFLNFAQTLIQRTHRFRELDYLDSSLATEAGTSTVELGRSWRDMLSVRLIDGTQSRKLAFIPTRLWDERLPSPTDYANARPTHYTWFQDNLELWRVPDAIYTLKIRGTLWATVFDSDDDVVSDLEEKDDVIVAFATAAAFRSLGEFDKAAKWLNTGKTELALAIKQDMSRTDEVIKQSYPGSESSDYWLDPFRRSMPR